MATMTEIIEYVAGTLVEKPEAIKVHEIKGARSTIYELSCDREDMGRLIGREGRIVKSLRILLKAMAARTEGENVELEIIE
jgi:hypothetical protein